METTLIKFPNESGYLLQRWYKESNDNIFIRERQNFLKSTKTSSPTSNSVATHQPTFRDSFMYIETS